jgi:hypothetical protein
MGVTNLISEIALRVLRIESEEIAAIEDFGDEGFGAGFAGLGADGLDDLVLVINDPVAGGVEVAGALGD